MISDALVLSYVALWLLVILHSLILLGVIRVTYQRQLTGHAVNTEDLKAGEEAPAFSAVDLSGNHVDSSMFAGRPSLLLFVTPTCPECVVALQDLQYLKEKANGNLVVICRAEREACARLVERTQVKAPLVADEDDHISRSYRVLFVPTAVLIDASGRIQSYGEPHQLEASGADSGPTIASNQSREKSNAG